MHIMKTTESTLQTQNKYNQTFERRKTAVLPKRNWVQKNPRLFSVTFITTSLLIFFSKPIYDCFFANDLPAPPGPASSRRSRY